jgi:hypothetical protein
MRRSRSRERGLERAELIRRAAGQEGGMTVAREANSDAGVEQISHACPDVGDGSAKCRITHAHRAAVQERVVVLRAA